MTLRIASICLCPILVLLVHSLSQAQEKSKSWLPKMFNRSTAESSPAPSKSASDTDSIPWYKQFGPTKETASPPKQRSSTSTLGKIGQTSKRWWDNTVDFINPFNDKPKSSPPPKNQGYAPQNEKKQSEGGGLFGWAKPEKTPAKPKSVNEFLGGTNPLLQPDL